MGMFLSEAPAMDRFQLPKDEFIPGAIACYDEQQAIICEYEGLQGMDLCDALYDAIPAIVELVRRRRLPCAGLAIHNVLMSYAIRTRARQLVADADVADDAEAAAALEKLLDKWSDAKAVEKAVNGERIVA